jgi:hypothetical protein
MERARSPGPSWSHSKARGADHVINYTMEDGRLGGFRQRVKEITAFPFPSMGQPSRLEVVGSHFR